MQQQRIAAVVEARFVGDARLSHHVLHRSFRQQPRLLSIGLITDVEPADVQQIRLPERQFHGILRNGDARAAKQHSNHR